MTIRPRFAMVVVLALGFVGCAQESPDLLSGRSGPATEFVAPNEVGQFITSLAADSRGRTWVGTEGNGIWRFDPFAPAQAAWTQFTVKNAGGVPTTGPASLEAGGNPHALGDDYAYAMAVDQQGRLWVGHLNHGVSVFNGRAWRNYDIVDGPIGERVFSIAVCPADGDVWIATSAGLTRYSARNDVWSHYTRADGLVSDEIQALAFDNKGDLYAGTQCDGLMKATRAGDGSYKDWRHIPGADKMPNAEGGKGLPSNLINDVLVARDGKVWVATNTGLAWSKDAGKTWQFTRGQDWEAKVEGLYNGPDPECTVDPTEVWLAEDYVTCLAEDAAGLLWVGFRQEGYQVFDPRLNQVTRDHVKDGLASMDYTFALLPTPAGTTVVGGYGSGAVSAGNCQPAGGDIGSGRASRSAHQPRVSRSSGRSDVAPPLPKPAAPPTLAELNQMLAKLAKVEPEPADEDGGRLPIVVSLNDDWRTEGDWLGRYGRYWACLCAICSPSDYLWGAGPERVEYAPQIGPNFPGSDSLRYWIDALYTDRRQHLEMPPIYLDSRVKKHLTSGDQSRRPAVWCDNGQCYPMTLDGSDLYCSLKVPAGQFYLSLYFVNLGGRKENNRVRDYPINIRPHSKGTGLYKIDGFDRQPELARTRVHDFWGGVYKRFLVRGPTELTIQIRRNNSINAMVSAAMLDLVDERPMPYFCTKEDWQERQANGERERLSLLELYKNPTAWADRFKPRNTAADAANQVFESLRQVAMLNPSWTAAHGRRFFLPLLRWNAGDTCVAMDVAGKRAQAERLTTCFWQTGLLDKWEEGQESLGLTPARRIEKGLTWDGVTDSNQGRGFTLVSEYLDALAAKGEGAASNMSASRKAEFNKLLAQLDDSTWAVREAATKQLRSHAREFRLLMVAALGQPGLPPEAQLRIKSILDDLHTPTRPN
jgi:hypothetical protein